MLRKLRLRLTLICALATGALLCALSLVLLVAAERRLMGQVSAAFEGNIATIAYQLQSEQLLRWEWLSQMEADQKLLIAVSDGGRLLKYPGAWQARTGRELLLRALRARAPEEAAPADRARYSTRRFTLTGTQGEPYLAAAVTIPARGAVRTLYLVKDLREVDLRGMRLFALALTALSALGLAAFSWWFAGKSIAPVERGLREQAQFVAAASHELRTPLAAMRANASALRCKLGAGDEPFAAAIDRECGRLGRLVDDLLTLAHADGGRLSLRLCPVEPEQLLHEAADACGALAAQRGVALEVLLPPRPLPVLAGDPQRMAQLLQILLDNAFSYAGGEGGRVALFARREGRAVVLGVKDNGPGIPPEQRGQVFRRFYRADPARSAHEHYGLGLSIAADIAKAHGAAFTLKDTPGGGLTVEYRQPVLRGAALLRNLGGRGAPPPSKKA